MFYQDSALVKVSIQRPNDALKYTSLDVINSSTPIDVEFLNVSKISGSKLRVISASLMINTSSTPTTPYVGTFRIHLYKSRPIQINDNYTYDLVDIDRNDYLGYVRISSPVNLKSTIYLQEHNINKIIEVEDGINSLYTILQTVDEYIPEPNSIYTISLGIVGENGV